MKKTMNLKNILLTIVALASIGLFSTYAVTASGTASVTLFTPLTIIQNQFADLGYIGLDGGGTVTLTPGGILTCIGFNSAVCSSSATPGGFLIKGASNTIVNIVYTNAILKNSTGSTITFIPIGESTVTLGNDGTGILNVGGSITILGTETGGVYSTENSGGVAQTVSINY